MNKIYQDHYTCKCIDGWKGEKCDEFYCETPCDINYGTCVGPNICQCTVDYKTGKYCNETLCDTNMPQCLNGAPCLVYENEIFCSCNQEKYAGKYCEKQCSPDCVYGICTFLNETTFCHCFKGFEGQACNETCKYINSILFSFGVGGYIRNNIKRNIGRIS
ncbi:hypothetical protein HZS_6585 [Henneguya salminicola]|nr:hypothetical protein HZS_6585 [Henneguya salminicola]